MKIPVLANPEAFLNGWKTGTQVEPEISWIGVGTELSSGLVDQIVSKLLDLRKQVPDTKQGKIQFDKEAAVILATDLPLNSADGSNPRFWTYFSMVKAPDIVAWRWDKQGKEQVAEIRFMGGLKNTFRRLWLRAIIVKDPDSSDTYALARKGGEDFWVSVIERQISACRGLVRAVVRVFFNDETNEEAQMMEHRKAIKWLREVRPSRVFEAMTPDESVIIASRALAFARGDSPP